MLFFRKKTTKCFLRKYHVFCEKYHEFCEKYHEFCENITDFPENVPSEDTLLLIFSQNLVFAKYFAKMRK